MKRAIIATTTLAAALSLGACAENSLMTTSLGSGAPATTAALPAKPKVDPACTTLAAQIAELRKDGLVDRVEAASKGKSSTVTVKRASLGQVAQLAKLDAEFQAKCSNLPKTAAAPASVPPAVAAAAKPVAAKATAAVAPKAATVASKPVAAAAAVTQPKQ